MSNLYDGKAHMCIKLLKVLNSGRLYSVSELANLIETKPRNIIEYKRRQKWKKSRLLTKLNGFLSTT